MAKMRKLPLVLLFMVLVTNMAGAKETILVSSPTPTVYAQNEDGVIVGPTIEMLQLIFNEIDVELKTVPLPWTRAIEYIKDGKIDAIAPIFYNEERSHFIEFSIAFDSPKTCVFTKKGKFDDFRTWDDLKGYRGIVVRGRSEGKNFDDFAEKNLNLIRTNSLGQVMRMLVSDRADYGIDKYYDTMAESKKMGLFEKIQFMPVSISTNEAFIGISKNSPFIKYLPEINEKIKQLREEGTIRKLLLDYIEKNTAQ